MKKQLALIFGLLLSANVFAQDTITRISGERFAVSVLEVNTLEIKYKKFDNLNGPTYTILKSETEEIHYKNGSKDKFNKTKQVTNAKSQVYFLRTTGFTGSLIGFSIFVDEIFKCKINNKKYSILDVSPGLHKFSVQMSGTRPKMEAVKIEINIEEGKTYYVQMVFQVGLLANTLYCQEVTENSAKSILPILSFDNECK